MRNFSTSLMRCRFRLSSGTDSQQTHLGRCKSPIVAGLGDMVVGTQLGFLRSLAHSDSSSYIQRSESLQTMGHELTLGGGTGSLIVGRRKAWGCPSFLGPRPSWGSSSAVKFGYIIAYGLCKLRAARGCGCVRANGSRASMGRVRCPGW